MLNDSQLVTLKAAILADPVLVGYLGEGRINAVVAAFNVEDIEFHGWKTSVPIVDIFDSIAWANLTPNDAPDGTQLWLNRSLACQGKQFNLQTMLTGRDSINAAKLNIRAGLQDALSNVPSGTGGTTVSAGWGTVKAVITRTTTRGERLFATGTGTAAVPAILVFEGSITDADVEQAMRL